jgi:hypothetical protein
MKIFTIDDIRSWKPCYDPGRHLSEGWRGTAIDLLKLDTIPPQDRLWVVLREDVLDAKTLRLFGVWCARQIEHLLTDDRSKQAIEVAERFANGQATDQELAAAKTAAVAAARAADAVARAADAWAADAAAAAARAAARAADAAAWAADAAAWAADAAARAADAAAWAADAAARAAARAARDAQVAQLLKMLEEKNENT